MFDNTYKIAVDISSIPFVWEYRSRMIQSIIRYAQEHTRWQLFFNDKNIALAHRFTEFEDLVELGVDGLLFFGSTKDKLQRVKALNIPAVTLSQTFQETFCSSVRSDNNEIGKIAATYFIEKGYDTFAFSGGEEYWTKEREEGFVKTLRQYDLNCSVLNFEFDNDPRSAGGIRLSENLRKWLAGLPKPVAILACNDVRGLHITEACLDLEIHVPNQVAVLGVDNSSILCGGSRPPLSSVDPNAERTGFEAAALMDQIIRKKIRQPIRLTIPPKGVVPRMSTDIFAFTDEAVAKAFVFIRDHLSEPMGVEEVIEASGISRGQLERRFFATFKRTIHEDITLRRLQKVKDYLSGTSLSLNEIAQLTGFRRATYLSQVFNAHMGISPGAWRKTNVFKY